MTKLSVPISSLFKNISASKKISAICACLECREESLQNPEPRQHLFHFENNIIQLWSNEERDSIISVIAKKQELNLITFHLAASCSNPFIKQGVFHCGGKIYLRQEMFDNIRNNVLFLKDCIHEKDINIAIENNNYYPTPAYRDITDADFITQVVGENKINFLFDLAHAKITAYNRKMPYQDYIKGLPLEKMIQMHVSKYGVNENGLAYDAHELPDEPLFHEVGDILNKFNPEYVTIEYYKNEDRLIAILKQYSQLCADNNGGKR
ncbi:DUF692 family multinuclear iron-containing protein [Thermoproteota archaeon]